MAAGIPESCHVAGGCGARPGSPGHRARAAYYGLAVIILATMLNFFDAQVFGIMGQRIKVDLHLSDEQLGFLIGPANVIFYVLVGIPMARLVDLRIGLALAISLAIETAVTRASRSAGSDR